MKQVSLGPFYKWGYWGSGSLSKSHIANLAPESMLLTVCDQMQLWSIMMMGFRPRECWGYYDSSCHFPSPMLNIPGKQLMCSFLQPWGLSTITSPVLQVRKQKAREVKWHAQDHTATFSKARTHTLGCLILDWSHNSAYWFSGYIWSTHI